MIIRCSACQARFRLDRQRVGGKRLTLRCSRCGEVFKVEVPAAGSQTRPVLVAHADEELCAAIGEILGRDSIPHEFCHHSDQAMSRLKTGNFPVTVLDVALPGMFAFQLIEEIKAWSNPAPPKIILLSSVYNYTAYKRLPSSLYGADDYIEKHHMGDLLVPKILGLGRAIPDLAQVAPAAGIVRPDGPEPASVPPGPEEGAEPFLDEINQKIRGAEEHEVASDPSGSPEAIKKAERLARIIVSDIALYNQSLVDEGVLKGTFFDLLAHDIEEGRRLFRERYATLDPDDKLLNRAFEEFVGKRREELLKHSS